MSRKTNSRIVVGMSGGVDSSVAAALLKRAGWDVIGVMLRLWSDLGTQNRCCAPDAVVEARQIAGQLEIPFYVMDARDAFYQAVVNPFIRDYAQGLTPNPCLRCNRLIRWDFLLARAKALGAEKIATGHYARVRRLPDGTIELLKNPDASKDQSYFLHVLSQRDLQHTIFPLAEYTKSQVRQLARKFSLPTADRPDSQDLCFVGQGRDYRDFLQQALPASLQTGPILDRSGTELGQHSGLAYFTIGQRKGLGIAAKEPYYVLEKRPSSNTLVVGFRSEMGRSKFTTGPVNWISGQAPSAPLEVEVKVRYQSQAAAGLVTPLKNGGARVQLEQKLPDITPGQAAVFYQGAICLGGGTIQGEEQ